MINFIISFILIFFSSYLFTSIFQKGKVKKFGALLLFLFSVSEIIISFEVLSFFKGITPQNFLLCNSLLLIVSVICFIKTKVEFYRFDIIKPIKELIETAKRDKSLFIVYFSLFFFILVSFFLTLISPVMYSDAMTYHILRAVNFLENSTLALPLSHDLRTISMPVNSEILQSWILLFVKKDFALSLFTFVSYLLSTIVLFDFVKEIGFSRRTAVWSVFIFSALAFTVGETSSADINSLSGSFILFSLYLLFCSQKYKNNQLLFLSSLSLSLCSGMKTTALFLVPFVFLLLIFILKMFKSENTKRTIVYFLMFFSLNFFILSSLNYFQNINTFKNPFTSDSQYELNKFPFTIKGYISNLINYGFDYIDFAGFDMLNFTAEPIYKVNEKIHSLINAEPDSYSSPWFSGLYRGINYSMLETQAGFGLMGLLAFIPSMFFCLFKLRKNQTSKKILFYLSLTYILVMLTFASQMVYTTYNIRYMTTFAFLILPIFALTYRKNNKNFYKLLLLAVCVYYLCFTSLNLNFKEISLITNEIKQNGITQTREKMRCSKWNFGAFDNPYCRIKQEIKRKYKDKKIAILPNFSDSILLLNGLNTEYKLLSDIKKEELYDFDIIISHAMFQHVNKINHPKDENIICHYLDREGKEIFENIEHKAVYCDCEIPYDYLFSQGFKVKKMIYDNPKTRNYDLETIVILSR